jgi:cytochrome c553
MKTLQGRMLLLLLLLSTFGMLVSMNARTRARAAGQDQRVALPERTFEGLLECNRCHDSGLKKGRVDLPGGITVDLDKERWVLYREFSVWSREDKHGQAYAVLLNDRSRKMGELLGVPEIHRDKRCLACHTGFPVTQMDPDEKDTLGSLVSTQVQKNIDIRFGVTCEGCHGAAGDARRDGQVLLQGWMTPHQRLPTPPFEKTNPWRFMAPATKAQHGFRDVRSPASRTRICASCHIGSVEEGRILTHEMYAAGHPPLPGFELETFVRQMPEHWEKLHNKSTSLVDLFLKNTNDPLYREGSYTKGDLHQARSLLVGALVASSQYLNVVAELADDQVASPVKRPSWPELAVFDCYACHHELKGDAWRRNRKASSSPPGRPPLQPWNSGLAGLALKRLGHAQAEYESRMNALGQAVSKQPFGNKKEIKKSAREAAVWLAGLGDDLQKRPFSRTDGLILLKEIADQACSETLDYESARQFVWAFRIIDGELASGRADIRAKLESLEKEMFLLDLRGGRKASVSIPGESQQTNILEVDLKTVLPLVANYDPVRFQERFAEIAKLLK